METALLISTAALGALAGASLTLAYCGASQSILIAHIADSKPLRGGDGRFTSKRKAKAIEMAVEAGRPDLADRLRGVV